MSVTPPSNSTIKETLKALWAKYSIFFIFVGILLLVAKYGSLVISILNMSSKKAVEDAQKTDAKLRADEDAANKQANDLIKQADELPKTKEKVDENWNKKGR